MSDLTWTNCTATLGALKPWADNPRFSTKKQARALLNSWRDLGQFQTIAIGPDGEVYDGHQRLSALLTVHGAGYPIDARRSNRALTDDERRRLVVTAHVGAVGSWDWDKLSGWNTATVGEWGMDADALKAWQTDAAALATMLEADKPAPVEDVEPQVDRAEELRVKWGVESGQLWQLGDHRLICGDCTDRAVVERVMDGERAEIMVTDPPYGVDYDPMWRQDALGAAVRRPGKVKNDDRSDWGEAWALFGGDIVYCWSAMLTSLDVLRSFEGAGFVVRAEIVWAKEHRPYGRGHYVPQHESCWYLIRSGETSEWCGDPMQSTLWKMALDETADGGHGTQKPLDAMLRPLSNHRAKIVYEPFSGSGTTLIACDRLGRKCRAIEIYPGYVAVALERWATATGKTPVLVV